MQTKSMLLAAGIAGLFIHPAAAAENWFVRPYVGLSQMSDLDSDFSNIDGRSGEASIELDTGFTGGIGVGYRLDPRYSVEFGWEYRSNDSETVLDATSEFDGGNYASNIFYLNGHYHFEQAGNWRPYVGAGLTWVEEIDIDLERGGDELSYSGDGDSGYQIFAGFDYDLAERWKLQAELRYGSIRDIDLDGEGNDVGGFDGIDYETTTLQLGLVYDF